MDSFTLLNGLHLTDYAFEPLFADGKSALQATLDRLAETETGGIYLFLPRAFTERIEQEVSLPDTCQLVIEDRWESESFLLAIQRSRDAEGKKKGGQQGGRKKGGEEPRFFRHLYADAPLSDEALSRRMVENHLRYRASYTFADAYPAFLAPELLSFSVIDQLINLYHSQVAKGESFPLTDTIFFDIIQKDINAFDIETEIAPQDMRMLRVKLAARGKRNYLLLKHIVAEGGEDEASILALLNRRPDLLRTVPAFINIQAVAACPQRCLFCPYPGFPGDPATNRDSYMSVDQLRELSSRVEQFCGDACISLSLWGEPALHPEISKMAGAVLAREKLSLLIETSGIGWKLSDLQQIASLAGHKRIEWIVSLDAFHEESYKVLRGEGMAEAHDLVRTLMELFPGQVYVQAVRTVENEAELEKFYRYWKKEGAQVIIQKYSTFAGTLQDRKVSDLSPVNRFPCWHVKRDFHILLDGTVPLCREILPGSDHFSAHLLGNVFEESLETIWNRGEQFYLKHIDEDYPPVCGGCDEYYTFNF
jgi:spiro-SPASM protein